MAIVRTVDDRFYDVPEDVLERWSLSDQRVAELLGVTAAEETGAVAVGVAVGQEDGDAEEPAADPVIGHWRNRRGWRNWRNWRNYH